MNIEQIYYSKMYEKVKKKNLKVKTIIYKNYQLL